jgi:hypothetical protein
MLAILSFDLVNARFGHHLNYDSVFFDVNAGTGVQTIADFIVIRSAIRAPTCD